MRSVVVALPFLLALAACMPRDLPYEVVTVPAAAETDAMTGKGDQADDPALWVHPADPAQSLILGSNKKEGLYVYGLDGRERQRLPIGRLNNIDVRGDLVVASNMQAGTLSWFRVGIDPGIDAGIDPGIDPGINNSGPVVEYLGDTAVGRDRPYGACLGLVGGYPVAAVTYRDGGLELWQASDAGAPPALPEVRRIREEQLDGQLEGCVFDDLEQRLFIGEEARGIWSLELDDPVADPVAVDSIRAGNGLAEDIEGMTLYVEPAGGYLLVSAQDADRYVVYERLPPHAVVGAFKIGPSADGTVDAVSHTDGIEASPVAFPGFPRGVLIVQDDANPRREVDQNFKLVDWRSIEAALGLPGAVQAETGP